MNDKTYKDVNGLEKDDLSLMYTLGEALGDLPTDDETQQAWAEFEAKHYRTNRRRKIVRLSIGVVAAAAVVLAAVLFVPWNRLTALQYGSGTFIAADLPDGIVRTVDGGKRIVSTPTATTLTVVLPDGTHVLLGAGSRIEYPESFDGQPTREVRLTGMARFDVHHDKSQPFIVHADGVRAEVLGTVFDIRAYPNISHSVTLYSGKVRVRDDSGRHTVTLKPGQMATLGGRRDVKVAQADLTAMAGWTHGMFIFDNERLEDVMNDIGSWYNTSIVFTDRRAADTRVHISLPRSTSLSDVLCALNDMGVAKFTLAGNKVTVK